MYSDADEIIDGDFELDIIEQEENKNQKYDLLDNSNSLSLMYSDMDEIIDGDDEEFDCEILSFDKNQLEGLKLYLLDMQNKNTKILKRH